MMKVNGSKIIFGLGVGSAIVLAVVSLFFALK
jgi:hypothetical protein